MKTVSGIVLSSKPISLSKATSTLSSFLSTDTGAAPEFGVYLRRALASFKELKQLHKDLKSPRSERRQRSRQRLENENEDGAETVGENRTRSVVVSQEVSRGLESKPKRNVEKKKKKGEFRNFSEDGGEVAERGSVDSAEIDNKEYKKKKMGGNVGHSDENGGQIQKGDGGGKTGNEERKKRKSAELEDSVFEEKRDKKKKRRKS